MADITKAEWTELREQLKALSERAVQVEHQLGTLTAKVEELREFQKQAQPSMSFVHTAKAILGLFALLIAGTIGTGIWRFATVSATVDQHAAAIGELKQSLEKTAGENRQANDRLRELVIEKLVKVVGSVAYDGEVVKAGSGMLTIKTNAGEKTFRLATDAEVFVGGKPARLEDLKPGMRVRVTEGEKGQAAMIMVPAEMPP